MTDTMNAQPLEEAPQRPSNEDRDSMATETTVVGWRVFALGEEPGMLQTPMQFQVGRGRRGELAGAADDRDVPGRRP